VSTPNPAGNEEFVIRVNDFIEMANRIARRFDTAHAESAMAHAFARFSAFHYGQTVKEDTQAERVAFCHYIANTVAEYVAGYMDQVVGPTPAQAPTAATPAAASEGESGTEA
jgi:hypothetical protein